ncbi:MAG: hypothetical protein U9O06_12955 [Euryarchaeota archaeon]|nr:hypothetical protein [Euryarchaeota archaeon]
MTAIELELSVLNMVVIVAIWTTVFVVLTVLSPPLLSNVVLSGVAGGISFVLSLLYLQESGT